MRNACNIEVKDISKKYTYYTSRKLIFKDKYTKEAVRDVSFEVKESEILAIVGPNGSGKSTIVKMVSGIIKRDKGTVSIMGSDPYKRCLNYRRSVGIFMGGKNRLNPDTSLKEYAYLYGTMYNLNKETINERIKSLANMLNLSEEKLNKSTRNLSLGERCKAEFILTFLNLPIICFLDEPTIGLDYKSKKSIRNFLINYVKKYKASIILTSHDMEDIENICTRILVINKGLNIYYGNTRDIAKKFDDYIQISFKSRSSNKEIRSDLNNRNIRNDKKNDRLILYTDDKEREDILKYIIKTYDVYDINIKNLEFADMIERIIGWEY